MPDGPTDADTSTTATAPPRHPLPWALYLGCSWTWVIGMFLPALLLRDYGWAGFWVFALPNVVGAAAMGFVLRDAASAVRLATEHRQAVRWFSWWTIAFHAFALPWLIEGVLVTGPGFGNGGGLLMGAALMAGMCAVVLRGGWRAVMVAAALVAVVSWGIAAAFLPTLDPDAPPFKPRLTELDLLFFAAPNLLGFLLCPYLDATFLRARASTSPGGGRVAFAVGFGVVFASMIGFAALYGPTILEGVYTEDIQLAAPLQLSLLALFIALQGSLTVALHLRELRRPIPDAPAPPIQRATQPIVVTLVAVGLVAGLIAALTHREAEYILPVPELIYRAFLTAYGVVIPAYVWLVVWPPRKNTKPPTDPAADHQRRLFVFAAASILAYPAGLIGFTTGPAWCMALCAAIVTLARLPIGVPLLMRASR
ncbi:MAG: hypothetical protein AAGB29_04085 [Planctomycetota bacterium]